MTVNTKIQAILKASRLTVPGLGRIGLTASFLLLSVWVFFGCGREEIAADLIPPGQVTFTERSSDTALVEQGIDAVPQGHYIYLSWLPSDADDIAGYRLYRQTEDSSDFQMIADVDEGTTEYEDHSPLLAPDQNTGLTRGFLYRVTAYDEAGNESVLSEEEYYRLLPKAVLSQPVFHDGYFTLSWSFTQYDPQDFSFYVVRLFREEGSQWIPFWLQQHTVPYPLEVTYTEIPLTQGRYRFQVDVIGAPIELPSGSEMMLEFDYP